MVAKVLLLDVDSARRIDEVIGTNNMYLFTGKDPHFLFAVRRVSAPSYLSPMSQSNPHLHFPEKLSQALI